MPAKKAMGKWKNIMYVDCAIDNECPIFYVDSNDMPILSVRRDLEPYPSLKKAL